MKDNLFEQLDFGAFKEYIDNDDITDVSYTNNGQIWIRSLTQGSLRVENPNINNSVVEKLAFQCSNVMGTTFNNASPFLDAESPELRMNFVHDSIATNGIALVIRKTPAKIRLKEETLLEEEYVTKDIHDFLIKCVHGHCNIMVCGETGSGKTEFVKYLASHTVESEKIITIEDTLELHLDKIYPHRDIVAMKTNNIASYSDVLVTCMRQNPKWILLSEVRSAEAVTAVRNSISSGHNILSTIHSDKANAIPHRLYSLMETDLDVDQFLNTIYRYVQMGVHIKAYYSPKFKKFHREIDEITEFYIDEDNKPIYNIIYQKTMSGKIVKKNPSQHLIDYLAAQNIDVGDTTFANEEDKGLSLDDVIGEKDEAEVLKEQQEKEAERKAQEEKEQQEQENSDSMNDSSDSSSGGTVIPPVSPVPQADTVSPVAETPIVPQEPAPSVEVPPTVPMPSGSSDSVVATPAPSVEVPPAVPMPDPSAIRPNPDPIPASPTSEAVSTSPSNLAPPPVMPNVPPAVESPTVVTPTVPSIETPVTPNVVPNASVSPVIPTPTTEIPSTVPPVTPAAPVPPVPSAPATPPTAMGGIPIVDPITGSVIQNLNGNV